MKQGKILFVANIHKHFTAFHLPYIKWFQENGYEVHVAANEGDTNVPFADKQWDICIERNPFNSKNIRAYKELKSIIDKENYCLITCHTAMGGVLARLAGRKRRQHNTLKMLYTAHGFHFYKGSPKSYWFMYYPMEKFLSKYTDAIITINQEDYDIVKTKGFKNKATFKIPGIGLKTERLIKVTEEQKQALRIKNGYNKNDFIMIYIAEYIPRKNHKFLIDSMAVLNRIIPNVKLLLAGSGRDMEMTKEYAKSKEVYDYIDFLGFRKDIGELIALSDIGVSSSRQEGLGLNLAEAMYSGLPVVASDIRGHTEMIIHTKTGFMFTQGNIEEFVKYIELLYSNKELRKEMGYKASEKAREFEIENSLKSMVDIYERYL